MSLKTFLSYAVASCFFLSQTAALASTIPPTLHNTGPQIVPTTTTTSSTLHTTTTATTPINLDLTSTHTAATLNHLLSGGATANIAVGGSHMTVGSNALVTPAETLAVYQVLSTGHQSIVLGSQGNAVGGTLNIGPQFSTYVSGLTIPHGVTAIDNAAITNSLNLAGSFVNAGTFSAVTSNSAVHNFSLSAATISNLAGGLMTSASGLSMSLAATSGIFNSGTINSGAALNLTSPQISNVVSSTSTVAGPVMQAVSDISIHTQSLINSGVISAAQGSLNIATMTPANLLIQNSGGSLNAINGMINIRDENFAGKFTTDLFGGAVNAKDLNINAANGSVSAMLESCSAVVNMTAYQAKMSVSQGSLNLGNMKFTGDPDFYNLFGDLVLQGAIDTSGSAIAFIAHGNIVGGSQPFSLTTEGGDVTMVAGANFTSSNTNGQVQPGSTPGEDMITVTSLQSRGDICVPTMTSIDTSSVTGSGGKVILIAPGQITMNSSTTITTDGTGIGKSAGDVTMLAGGANGLAIYTGSISAKGSSQADSGNIYLANQMPGVSTPVCFFYGSKYGSFDIGAQGSNAISAQILDVSNYSSSTTGAAGNITVKTDGMVQIAEADSISTGGTMGAVTLSGGAGVVVSGPINVYAAQSGYGGAVFLDSSSGDVSVYGDISANGNGYDGGTVSLSANGSITTGNIYAQGSNGSVFLTAVGGCVNTQGIDVSGPSGGSISASAGTTISVGSPIYALGTGGAGGSLLLHAVDVSVRGTDGGTGASINATGTSSGGSITIQATDTAGTFAVGGVSSATSNGTDGSILADGGGGSIHVSACAQSIVITPPAILSAQGGSVTLDRACCTTTPAQSVGMAPVVQNAQVVAGYTGPDGTAQSNTFVVDGNVTPPQGTVLSTDTAYGGPASDSLQSPSVQTASMLLSDPSNNAFLGSNLVTSYLATHPTEGIVSSLVDPNSDTVKSLDYWSHHLIFTDQSGNLKYAGDVVAVTNADGTVDLTDPNGNVLAPDVGVVSQDGMSIVAQGGGNVLFSLDGSGHIIAQGGGNLLTLDGAGNIVAQGGGNIVAQGGGNIVAQGGGNIVAQGGGNIVAQGGGNIVAQGGGNLVAQGGGNIVAQGGGNIISVVNSAGNIVAQGGGNLVNGAMGIVAQGGGNLTVGSSLIDSGSPLLGQAVGIVAQGGGNLLAQAAGQLIAQGGGNLAAIASQLVAQGGGNIVAQGGGNLAQSLMSSSSLLSNATSMIQSRNDAASLASTGWGITGDGFHFAGMAAHAASGAVVVVKKGGSVFTPDKATIYAADKAKIMAQKGTIAMVVQTSRGLAVYNLHDERKNALLVDWGDGPLSLPPGTMTTLSSYVGPFEQVCPGRGLAYRNAQQVNSKKYNAYIAEFSIPSAMANVPPVKLMVTSRQGAYAKRGQAIMKDAAILTQLRGSNGAYKPLVAKLEK